MGQNNGHSPDVVSISPTSIIAEARPRLEGMRRQATERQTRALNAPPPFFVFFSHQTAALLEAKAAAEKEKEAARLSAALSRLSAAEARTAAAAAGMRAVAAER